MYLSLFLKFQFYFAGLFTRAPVSTTLPYSQGLHVTCQCLRRCLPHGFLFCCFPVYSYMFVFHMRFKISCLGADKKVIGVFIKIALNSCINSRSRPLQEQPYLSICSNRWRETSKSMWQFHQLRFAHSLLSLFLAISSSFCCCCMLGFLCLITSNMCACVRTCKGNWLLCVNFIIW